TAVDDPPGATAPWTTRPERQRRGRPDRSDSAVDDATGSCSAVACKRAGAVLVEGHDEWQTGDRRYLAEASMAALTTPPADTTTELLAA
ncbi:hypothetical protein AB0M20_35010, partial [Actinoplanes sp. NPDC051633]